MRAIIGVLLVLAVLAGVATYSYNLGVAQGFAQSGKLPSPAPGAGPYPAYPIYPYGYPYHGPFGFGFFGLFWAVLLVFIVLALLRGLSWRRHAWGGSWGKGAPPWFEEWHRRAHESKGTPGTA